MCVGDTIVLNTLRYPDEMRDAGELKIPSPDSKTAAVTVKELKMAMALVEGMNEDWEPTQYHDTYREDVLALVKKKIKARQTKTITQPEPEKEKRTSGKVIDLVALLQASLGKKPAKAALAALEDDDDDDDDPPPRKARKPADDEDDDDEVHVPRARKASTGSSSRTSAAKSTRTTASKAAAKPAARKAAAKKAPAKAVAKAPARKKAA